MNRRSLLERTVLAADDDDLGCRTRDLGLRVVVSVAVNRAGSPDELVPR